MIEEDLTWGIKRLGVPELWKRGYTGEGVLIGHLDTGVDHKHPVFSGGAIAFFAEFDLQGKRTPNKIAYDSGNHGTHTGATMVGRPLSGRKRVGVAPGAKLASAIVAEGGDISKRVLAGIEWAINKDVRIVNFSQGVHGYIEDFLEPVNQLRKHNILPVFSVGNEGVGRSRSPGNYAQSLSVGAITSTGHVAPYSSSMRMPRTDEPLVPDLVAPGDNVVSAGPGGQYLQKSGSSMAAPHISGLAALLWQAAPDATAHNIEEAIFKSCQLAPLPKARANRGVPHALRALNVLLSR